MPDAVGACSSLEIEGQEWEPKADNERYTAFAEVACCVWLCVEEIQRCSGRGEASNRRDPGDDRDGWCMILAQLGL